MLSRAIFLLASLLFFASQVLASDVVLSSSQLYNEQETWWLDVAFDFEFSDDVLDALHNGVPITIDLLVEVRPESAWIWEKSIMQRKIRLQLYYRALAEIYQVKNIGSGAEVSFASKSAAIAALGEVLEIPLVTDDELKKGEDYEVTAKSSLNIESLPVPLRPVAYMSPAWYYTSDRYSWKIEN